MGECACAPAVIGNCHVVERPHHLYGHAFVVIVIESHWVFGMKFIYRLTLDPAAFKLKQTQDQARVDGVFIGEAFYGIIPVDPAG